MYLVSLLVLQIVQIKRTKIKDCVIFPLPPLNVQYHARAVLVLKNK